MTKKQKKMLIRIIVTAVLLAALMIVTRLIAVPDLVKAVLFLIPYIVIGYDILRRAGLGLIRGKLLDENFLMAVATVGVWGLGIWNMVSGDASPDFEEAVAVMLFYQTGEFFQSYAVGKSRKNITSLMDIRPDYANIEGENGLEQVDPDDVEIGTVIVVQPGEKVPIDGIIVEGSTTLNTAALTGESLPRDAACGDEIISGCINMTGLIRVETTKEFGDSTVSKILDLVENSSMKKSRSENFISKFAKIYTPVVCSLALALAILPPVILLLTGHGMTWTTWIPRALNFLVISCPCALVISIPLSFFGGIGGASAKGVLVKGSNYLETLSQVKYMVFDKTGTLTKGTFSVTDTEVDPSFGDWAKQNGYKEDPKELLLQFAAYAESYSNHPISKSLKNAYGKDIKTELLGDVKEHSGHGVEAVVEGHRVLVGNGKLLKKEGLPVPEPKGVGTVTYVVTDGVYAGYILIADTLKDHAKEALDGLHKEGVKKIVMLTGDADAVAQDVGKQLSVDEIYSELLPGDKVDKVEQLLAKKASGEMLAFVGDGINDAPVLTRADIGIAMGAMGSDAAIEAADVVLMDDDPKKIVTAIGISRKTLRIVYENIVFALGVKFLCLALSATLNLGMWIAIIADVGVMILAVLNATRALTYREPKM